MEQLKHRLKVQISRIQERRYIPVLSLRAQIIALMLLVLLPVFWLVFIATEQQKEIRQVQVKDNLLQMARLAAANHEQTLEGARQLLVSLSVSPQVTGGDTEVCSELLERIAEKSRSYLLVAVADIHGDVTCSSMDEGAVGNISNQSYFQQALNLNQFSVGDYQVGTVTGEPSLGFGYPVHNSVGKTQAIVFLTIDLSTIQKLDQKVDFPSDGFFHLTVIDRKGSVLLHLPGESVKVGSSLAGSDVFEQVERDRLEGNFQNACLDNDETCLYAFHRLEPGPYAGYAIVYSPERHAFAAINASVRYQLVGLSIVLLFALLSTWIGGDVFLIQKIRAISRAMQQVKMGQFRSRTGISSGTGELNQLASAFDDMAGALEQRDELLRSSEAARFASEMRLANILQNASEAIISVDEKHNIVVFNLGAERIFGFRSEELVGKSIEYLMPGMIDNRHIQFLRALGNTSDVSPNTVPAQQTLTWVRKSGQVFPGEVSTCLMNEQDGKLFTIFLADVTLRQQVMNDLQESRRALSTLLSNLPGMAYRAKKDDGTWIMEFASEGALGLTGYPPEGLVRERQAGYRQLIHPDDRGLVAEEIEESIALEQPYHIIYRIHHASGKEKWVWEQGRPVEKRGENEVILEGFVTDITERREAEEKVESQMKRLAALRAVDTAILGLLDLQPILNTLVEQVVSQLKVSATAILLYQANLLEYAAGAGFQTRMKQKIQVRMGEGFIGEAAAERRFIFCENTNGANEEKGFHIQALQNEGFISYAAVPLITKSEVKGVLCVFNRTPLHVTEEWRDYLEALSGQAAIAIENASLFQQVKRSNLELMMAYEETIQGWANALELRDQETLGHSRRVVNNTLRLAKKLGIPEEEMVHIRRGAILHDIGKMGVPDSILLKKGPLTEDEWTIMRQHPDYALQMLSSIPFLRSALDVPYCHHERWDGSGYPRELKGREIPLAARIFTIVDVWDALTHNRPYHTEWSEENARQYLREQSGKMFDPQLVELFLSMLDQMPKSQYDE